MPESPVDPPPKPTREEAIGDFVRIVLAARADRIREMSAVKPDPVTVEVEILLGESSVAETDRRLAKLKKHEASGLVPEPTAKVVHADLVSRRTRLTSKLRALKFSHEQPPDQRAQQARRTPRESSERE